MTNERKGTFVDDNNHPIKAVTAEQHAIDNPGHTVTVGADPDTMLILECQHPDCEWFDESQIYFGEPAPSCGHIEWADGYCAEMSCDNYVMKHARNKRKIRDNPQA